MSPSGKGVAPILQYCAATALLVTETWKLTAEGSLIVKVLH